jgi:hypothetical protein
LLHLRSREKHQQQQTEPVHEIKYVALMLCRFEDPRSKGQPAQKRRTKNDAGKYLTNDFRLAQPYKQVAQQLGEPDQQEQREKNRRQLGVRHALIIPSLEATDHSDACTGSGAPTIIANAAASFIA